MFDPDYQPLVGSETEFLQRDIHHELWRSNVGNRIGAFKINRIGCCRLVEKNRVIFARLEPAVVGIHLIDLKIDRVRIFKKIHQRIRSKTRQFRRLLEPDAELGLIRTDDLARIAGGRLRASHRNLRSDKFTQHALVRNQPHCVRVVDPIYFQQAVEADTLPVAGQYVGCHFTEPRRPFANLCRIILCRPLPTRRRRSHPCPGPRMRRLVPTVLRLLLRLHRSGVVAHRVMLCHVSLDHGCRFAVPVNSSRRIVDRWQTPHFSKIGGTAMQRHTADDETADQDAAGHQTQTLKRRRRSQVQNSFSGCNQCCRSLHGVRAQS